MMGKHTEGPWKVTSAGFDDACDSGDACYYIAAPNGMEVSKANARLIAAAPDGYAANVAALGLLEEIAEADGLTPELDAVITGLRAAIAKARGEA
jgi:hypothetical protein|tara:strand:+ start:15341 stop:15625 length:285 start_codon:yes stop_codon:yes gene_type:complete